MITKRHKLWIKIGTIAFTCDTIQDAIQRVHLFFQSWYNAGACKESDRSDWNIWSNRRTKTGGRKHIANVFNGEIA